MKKKIVSILLTACMLLTLIPAVAITVGAAEISTAPTAALTSGSYVLTADITANISIPSNAVVTLDLNGHVLTGTGDGSVIVNKGTLTITDGNATATHTQSGLTEISGGIITGGNAEDTDLKGGGIFTSGPLTVLGGTIYNNNGGDYGGGIYVGGNKGTLLLCGGSILKNTAFAGGGIYGSINNVITMTGGVISENKADQDGGGIVAHKLTVSGGVVTKNQAGEDTVNGYGGGIWIGSTAAAFTLSGGTVSENTATILGGGIYQEEGTVNITGGSVAKNQSGENGGGLYFCSGTLTMTGGSISENIAGYDAGGVYACSGTFNLSGGSIWGNQAGRNGGGVYSETTVKFSGGSIYGNHAVENNGGFGASGDLLTVGGTAKIYGNECGYACNLSLDVPMNVGNGTNGVPSPMQGMNVWVTVGDGSEEYPIQFTVNGSASDAQYFTSDTTGEVVEYNADGYLQMNTTEDVYDVIFKNGNTVLNILGAPDRYTEGVGISAEVFSKVIPETPAGKKFMGWYTGKGGGGTKVTSISASASGYKICYAYFVNATGVTLTTNAIGGYLGTPADKTPVVAFGATFEEYNSKTVQKYGFFIYKTDSHLDSALRGECSVELSSDLVTAKGMFFATVSDVGTETTYYAKAYVVIDGVYYFSSIMNAVGNETDNLKLTDD